MTIYKLKSLMPNVDVPIEIELKVANDEILTLVIEGCFYEETKNIHTGAENQRFVIRCTHPMFPHYPKGNARMDDIPDLL